MSQIRWIVALGASLAAFTTVSGQPSEAALKVLRAADDATRAVHAVSYTARQEAFGAVASREPAVTGSVTLARHPSFEAYPAKVHYQGTAWNPGSSGPLVFTSAFDGDKAYLINPDGNLFFVGDGTGQGLRLLFVGDKLLMSEFASAEPFGDEIGAHVATSRVGRMSTVCSATSSTSSTATSRRHRRRAGTSGWKTACRGVSNG